MTDKQIQTSLKSKPAKDVMGIYNKFNYTERQSNKGRIVWDMMLQLSGSYSK